MRKSAFVYILIVAACCAGIFVALRAGKQLETSRVGASQPAITQSSSIAQPASAEKGGLLDGLARTIHDNFQDPLSLLLVQIILIILLARVFGALLVKLGQPAVIGEMIAGIVLGPSVIGALFPGAFHFVFPAQSQGALRILSQVGVILFMFVVGMDLDVKQLRSKAYTAVMVSHTSIVFPYFLGVLFSLYLYRDFASPNAPFLSFALFMGIAMSITAFPVLARIIEERGLGRTQLGAIAITCAAVDDVSAWTILAFVVAIAKAGPPGAVVLTLVCLVLFVAAMLFVVKPYVQRLLHDDVERGRTPSRSVIVGILILVFASGLFTELIGVHALFGAFLAGVIMPNDIKFRRHLEERLQSFSSAFLLPLFFAFTGLRTQVGLLNDWESFMACLGVIGIATIGKLGGSMIVARGTGMNWHDSFSLGALMNTRGLVELIVLNIGLDLGILTPHVFTMMVIMALFTTFMTSPLLSLADFLQNRKLSRAVASTST